MKKGFFLVTIFIVLCCKLSAQWSYYCHFPINPPPPILNGTFGSADFISADTGVYSQSFYISPSSGSAFFVCNTTDGAATWNTTFGGFMNVGIRAVRKQRTFYVIDYNPTSNSLFLSKSPDGGSSWINMGNLNFKREKKGGKPPQKQNGPFPCPQHLTHLPKPTTTSPTLSADLNLPPASHNQICRINNLRSKLAY